MDGERRQDHAEQPRQHHAAGVWHASVRLLRRLVLFADQGRGDQATVLEHVAGVDPEPADVLGVLVALGGTGGGLWCSVIPGAGSSRKTIFPPCE